MLVAVLVVGVVGACSGDDDDSSSRRHSSETTTTTAAERSTSGTTAGPGPGTNEQAGGSSGSGSGSGKTNGGGATTTSAASPDQEVEAAYDAYWAMRERAIKFPNADDPQIEKNAGGPALDQLVATVDQLDRLGQQGQFGPLDSHHVFDVQLVAGTSDQATVKDCALSDSRVVVARTGEMVRRDPPEGTAYVYTAHLVRTDGVWRVTGIGRATLTANQACSHDGPVTETGS
jgi:hypothetical protein